MKTAVAFLIFNRPVETARVFAAIAQARPPRLLVVADGPRHAADRALCAQARAVVERVDWPCAVQRCYAEENLGCKRRVASGLDWVFAQVEEAIILEDDCLPHPDFFPFCEELLARYRDEPHVGHIGGTDYNRGGPRGSGSYYLSRYTSIWGWATWRRAWQDYDVDLRAWPGIRAAGTYGAWFGTPAEAEHFRETWNDIHSGELDTWDGQWFFCNRRLGRLAVSPNGNLISNIGCGVGATHTRQAAHPFAALPLRGVRFPLAAPDQVVADDAADLDRAKGEFLRRPALVTRMAGRLRNRHWYGQWLRRLPVIGSIWAAWREGKRTEVGGRKSEVGGTTNRTP